MNSGLINQNIYNPSATLAPLAPQWTKPAIQQNPDLDPNGVVLAPFPGDSSNAHNLGTRSNFNYDNLYHRYPSQINFDSQKTAFGGQSNVNIKNGQQTNIDSRYGGQSNVDSRSNGIDGGRVQLAGYSGSYVPLAPF